MSGTHPAVQADRRRRDRGLAWFVLVMSVIGLVSQVVEHGWDMVHINLVLVSSAWLLTEYQREREAAR